MELRVGMRRFADRKSGGAVTQAARQRPAASDSARGRVDAGQDPQRIVDVMKT